VCGVPVWLWGALGGLLLGPVGLVILWPGCSRGAVSLLKRFAVSMLIKLGLALVGFYVALKQLGMSPEPLAYGFFVGYFLSLILEISLCAGKVRKCAENLPPMQSS